MPRALWPPRGVFVPTEVIVNDEVSYAAFRFYVKLRALAWGDDSFCVDEDVLLKVTGLSRTRVFEYARLLRLCNALRWRCSERGFEYSFPKSDEDESRNPVYRDLPDQSLIEKESIATRTHKSKTKAIPKNGKAGSGELSAERMAMERAYVGWLGYKPPGFIKAVDSEALDWLAERFTPEQVQTIYEKNKASKFWSDKQIRPEHLSKMVAEHYEKEKRDAAHSNGKANGHGANRPSAEQLRRIAEIKQGRGPTPSPSPSGNR